MGIKDEKGIKKYLGDKINDNHSQSWLHTRDIFKKSQPYLGPTSCQINQNIWGIRLKTFQVITKCS